MAKDYFPEGFACPDSCGLDSFDSEMRRILNEVREELAIPLVINSACRCAAHNAAVGGAPNSAHLLAYDGFCHAVDISCLNPVTRGRIHSALFRRGIRRFEASNRHLHADRRADLPWPLLEVIWFLPDGTRAK